MEKSQGNLEFSELLIFTLDGGCPEDFFLAQEGGDICYFVSGTSETYSWQDGRTACENKGTSLAELKTDEESYAVEVVLLTYGWCSIQIF